MSINRWAKKRDANELEIVHALQDIGCTIIRCDDVDLIVGYQGVNYLMEVKDPIQKPKKATSAGHKYMKPHQRALLGSWRGQINIIESLEDALKILGINS